MSLDDDIKSTDWQPLSPKDRGPTAPEIIALAGLRYRAVAGFPRGYILMGPDAHGKSHIIKFTPSPDDDQEPS